MGEDIAFVEREWLAVAPDGTERRLVLRIGNLSRQPTGDWAADVSLTGVEPRTYRIHGIDTWQAVHEGMRFAAARIRNLEENGWAFYFERGDQKASASDLFRGG
jgi:hypothetical protein